MTVEFLKELYFHEWDRKEHLAQAANLPIAILTALLGASLYALRTFPYEKDATTALFVLLVGASLGFQVAAISYVIRSLSDYYYGRLPPTAGLLSHENALLEWHRNWGGCDQPDSGALADFEAFLQQRFAEAIDQNRENNRKTGGALHDANKLVVRSLAIAGLAFLPYFAQTLFLTEQPSPRVAIDGVVEVALPKEFPVPDESKDQQSQQQQQQQSQQQTQAPPPKPEGPQNEQVRKDGSVSERR